MLNLKALIIELSAVYGVSVGTLSIGLGEVSSLNIHSFHYSVKLCVSVAKALLTSRLLDTAAELLEVFTSFWANVFKKFNNNFGGNTRASVDVHVNVGSARRFIDG